MSGDTFRVDVTSEGYEHFKKIFSLFDRKAEGYRIDSEYGFVLYWAPDSYGMGYKVIELPYRMNMEQAAELAWGWLNSVPYPDEPDNDCSNHKGFRIYNEDWGHVAKDHYAFLAIQPQWIMYGK